MTMTREQALKQALAVLQKMQTVKKARQYREVCHDLNLIADALQRAVNE